MLALSLPAAMREAKHGFARPKREHGSRTPRTRPGHLTTDRSQSGNNDLSATELLYADAPRHVPPALLGAHRRASLRCFLIARRVCAMLFAQHQTF